MVDRSSQKCASEKREAKKKTVGYMMIPVSVLAFLLIIGLFTGGTFLSLFNPTEDCDCTASGIRWSINEDLYVDIYDDEVLLDEGNESFDIAKMVFEVMIFDPLLGEVMAEIEDEEDLYEIDMITYMANVYIPVSNITDIVFLGLEDYLDALNYLADDSDTILDGEDGVIYLDPAFIVFGLYISVCQDGVYFNTGIFYLFDFFEMESPMDMFDLDVTLLECGYIDINILGFAYDISIEGGGFSHLYVEINGEEQDIEMMFFA